MSCSKWIGCTDGDTAFCDAGGADEMVIGELGIGSELVSIAGAHPVRMARPMSQTERASGWVDDRFKRFNWFI